MADQANPAAGAMPGANANQMPQVDANLVNPLDLQNKTKEDTELLKNIVSTTTGGEQQKILDEAPDLDISVLKGVEPPQSLLLVVLKLIFGISLSISVAAFLFFTSQLTDHFDSITGRFSMANVSNDLSSSNQEVMNLQTELNVFRYLQAKSYLDSFSYVADRYIQNFNMINNSTVSQSEKNEASAELEKLKEDLMLYLESAKENLQPAIHVQIIDADMGSTADLQGLFKENLKTELKAKAAEYAKVEDDADAKMAYKNYIQTLSLVDNSNLRSMVLSSDLAEMDEGETYEFVKDMLDLIVNDLSTIQEIKALRLKWSDMINEIILRTTAVDNYYSEDFYDELGGIRYSSYDFDSANRQITIVGETKRFDTRNFTMIADLIDELNQSGIFANGEMRSFSKSGSFEDGYTATLKLTLDIVEEDFSDPEVNLDLK